MCYKYIRGPAEELHGNIFIVSVIFCKFYVFYCFSLLTSGFPWFSVWNCIFRFQWPFPCFPSVFCDRRKSVPLIMVVGISLVVCKGFDGPLTLGQGWLQILVEILCINCQVFWSFPAAMCHVIWIDKVHHFLLHSEDWGQILLPFMPKLYIHCVHVHV